MGSSSWIHVSLAAVTLTLVGCGGSDGGEARWPEINPGCGRVELFPPGQVPPGDYQVLRDFSGNWDEPDKDLRHWLINKACEVGADAVVDVVETQGHDSDGGPVWNIRGTAVVWKR